jgi:hypothetical protein
MEPLISYKRNINIIGYTPSAVQHTGIFTLSGCIMLAVLYVLTTVLKRIYVS